MADVSTSHNQGGTIKKLQPQLFVNKKSSRMNLHVYPGAFFMEELFQMALGLIPSCRSNPTSDIPAPYIPFAEQIHGKLFHG